MNKLEGFPTVHYISLRESIDRRSKLENWFDSYDINYIPHIFDRVKNLERYDFSHTFPNMVKPIFISHFTTIRDWYFNTDEEYAIICEDDLSLETVKYWNFTWKEFQNKLPDNWQCVQLVVLRHVHMWEEPYDYKFTPREPLKRGHWGACAYLIKREYAENLILKYNQLPYKFTLNLDISLEPDLEQVLFLDIHRRVYVFPLFVEDCYGLDTTRKNKPDEFQFYSHDYVINWWKTVGRNLSLDQIFS